MNVSPCRLLMLVALAACALAAPLGAQTWVPVGPPGGDVRSLAADPRDPRRIYLGTADGVLYRSDDGGLRWRRQSPGFSKRGQSLDDLWVDPHGTIVVGYWEVGGSGGGVARSTDGGRTFTILPGIAGQSVRALAIAPSSPDILVAGAIAGVFRSMDGGRTWARISPEGSEEIRNVESVAIDPVEPDVIYAGTWHLPWKTLDGGRTWKLVPTGFVTDSDVMTLTVDRRSRDRLYATACTGIYRSQDAAARWTKIKGIPNSSRRTRAFAQDPDRPDMMYAGTTEGLWVSEDCTGTWRLATPSNLIVNAVLALPGGAVLLGTEGAGVVRSSDYGRAWIASNDGFSERFVSRVVFDTANRRVLAGVMGDRRHGGVFAASTPRGPWTKLGDGLQGREVLALAAASGSVLAGTDNGVFALQEEGWRRLPTVVDGFDAHPRVKDVVALPGGLILAATSGGLLRSADGGATWGRCALGAAAVVSAVAASTRAPGVVIAATPLGVFTSRDRGESWSQVSAPFADAEIHSIAFLPGDDRVVFATTPKGLLRSANQGHAWTLVLGGLPVSDITGLALHPDGRTLYASDFTWGGVFRSRDGGTSWERLPGEGLASGRVWTVVIDPASPDRLLAAAASGGLHLLALPATAASAGTP
ncbi:MAG TPA: hypothetical protein VGL15_14755 [Vicinamibacteria bacterium]